MKEKNSGPTASAALHQKADAQLQKKLQEPNIPHTETEMLQLIQELKMYQIELEIQNEQLMENEAALKRSQLLLKSSIDCQKDTILLSVDHHYRYLYFNQAHWDSMKYAYDMDVKLGMNILECITSDDDRKTAKENYDRALTGESHSNVGQYGVSELAWYESFFNPIVNENNEIIGATGLARNITQRKLALESIRDMNWRLESLVESTHVGTWEWNIQTGETVFNERWAQIIGYSLGELAPVSIKTWELLSHPEDLINSNEVLRKHFAGELPYYDFECRMKHKNGQWIWIHDRGRVVTHSGDGKPLMMFGTHTDITQSKQVEETLRKNEENLQKLNAEKDKFFSIIAHDLRSPFSGFLGLTGLMVEGLPGMSMDEIQEMAGLLQKSAKQLFSMLGNLLEWSRMQRGLIAFAPSSILLKPKISDSMVFVKDLADKKGILICLAVPDDLVVLTDGNMLEAILRNLITNAVKFTPKGGIITVSAKSITDNSIGISVCDTGIGMTKDLIDNLFHLDINTNRRGTEGEASTGLGLIICKDFIEQNGGKLEIESEVGKGSVFHFTIPRKEQL